jgi:predicted phosphodiesterase
MKRIEFELPADCEIIALGDTHIGSVLCHRGGIKKVIDYIKNTPNVFWLHMGDWIEAIASDDIRYSSDTVQQPIPLKQAQDVIDLFKPIADKGICGLKGNHELKLHRYGDLAEFICRSDGGLGINYGTYAARVVFKTDKKEVFKAFLWHGPTKGQISSNAKDWEQRQANMRAALKMKLKYKMADCAIMLMGHVHKLIAIEPTRQLIIKDGKDSVKHDYLSGKQTGDYIDPDLRWYGCTGAFLKLYQDGVSGYAEIAGYDPVELGYLKIKIIGGIIKDIERIII